MKKLLTVFATVLSLFLSSCTFQYQESEDFEGVVEEDVGPGGEYDHGQQSDPCSPQYLPDPVTGVMLIIYPSSCLFEETDYGRPPDMYYKSEYSKVSNPDPTKEVKVLEEEGQF